MKYEYKETKDNNLYPTLNEMGANGWELVSAFTKGTLDIDVVYTFIRPTK